MWISRRTTLHRQWCYSKHLLHCIMDFAVGFLHLEFEDKHTWLICLLHVSVASGSGLRLWTLVLKCCLFLFLPQQPRVCSTRSKTALRWAAPHSEGDALWPALVGTFSVWGALWIIIMHCALNNIIIQGRSLQAAGNGCYFLSSISQTTLIICELHC